MSGNSQNWMYRLIFVAVLVALGALAGGAGVEHAAAQDVCDDWEDLELTGGTTSTESDTTTETCDFPDEYLYKGLLSFQNDEIYDEDVGYMGGVKIQLARGTSSQTGLTIYHSASGVVVWLDGDGVEERESVTYPVDGEYGSGGYTGEISIWYDEETDEIVADIPDLEGADRQIRAVPDSSNLNGRSNVNAHLRHQHYLLLSDHIRPSASLSNQLVTEEGSEVEVIQGTVLECPGSGDDCDDGDFVVGPGVGPGATVNINAINNSGVIKEYTTTTDSNGDFSVAVEGSDPCNYGDTSTGCVWSVDIDGEQHGSSQSTTRISPSDTSSATLYAYVNDIQIADTRPTGQVTSSITLEADIDADSVSSTTVEFYDADTGESYGSDTVSGSGTASTSINLDEQGTYTIDVEAADDEYVYNNDDSATYSFDYTGPTFEDDPDDEDGDGTVGGYPISPPDDDPDAISWEASPTGDVLLDDTEVTYSIGVTGVGDGTDVTFYDCDNDICTEATEFATVTLTEDGVAHTTYTPDRGRNTWYATVGADSTGAHDYRTPGELRILDNSDGTLIDSTEVTLEVSRSGFAETHTTTDGTWGFEELSELEDSTHAVGLSAEGYLGTTYTGIPPDTNSDLTMIPDGTGTTTVTFVLDDRTGNFPTEDTRLIVATDIRSDGEIPGEIAHSEIFGGSDTVIEEFAEGSTYDVAVENIETGGFRKMRDGLPIQQDDFTEELVIFAETPQWSFDASSASPHNEVVAPSSTQFSINLQDLTSETVNVSFIDASDSSEFGSTQISGDGTATASITDTLSAGENRVWRVRGEDQSGAVATSGDFSVGAAGVLTFRDADTNEVLDDRVIDVEVLDEEGVIADTTVSNGEFDFSSISPIPQGSVDVTADTDGYLGPRTREFTDVAINDNFRLRSETAPADPIEGEGDLNVNITDTNAPIQATDTLIVDVKVANPGSESETGVIALNESGEGTVVDSQQLTVGGGATTNITLEWATNSDDIGSRTITASSGTDSDSRDVTILDIPDASGDIAVEITDTNSPVDEGGTVEATVQATNNADTFQEANITLKADGAIQDLYADNWSAGETKTVVLEWHTGQGDEGERVIEVESGTDSDSTTVTVQVPEDRQRGDNQLDVTFELRDYSGEFNVPETTLVIKGLVETDEGRTFEEIDSGKFGAANAYGTELESGARHQLSIRDGDSQRDLGEFQISQGGLYTLEVQPRDYNLTDERPWSWEVEYVEENFTLGQREYAGYITFSYADSEKLTTQLDLTVHEYLNDANVIYEETVTPSDGEEGLGNYSVLVPLTQEQTEKRWVVEFEATRDGETIKGERVVGDTDIELLGEIPVWLRQAIAFMLLIMLAGLFSPLNATLGAVVVSVVGGLMFLIGWLPGLVTAAGILVALGVNVLYLLSEGDRR